MGRFRGADEFVRAVVGRVRRENVPFMAGSIAYQAFMSLVPLLVLTILFLSVLGGERFATETLTYVDQTLSPNIQPLVRAAFSVDATIGASVLGVVTLLWGSFRVFRGLSTAFSAIYGTHADGGVLDQIVDGLVAIAVLLVALSITTIAATAVAAAGVAHVGFVVPVLLVGGLLVAFFPIYWRFPDKNVSVRATVPGVFVAAVGWTLFQVLFEIYVAFASGLNAANVLGAMLFLLAWLYFNSFILLLGAAVNAVIAERAQ